MILLPSTQIRLYLRLNVGQVALLSVRGSGLFLCCVRPLPRLSPRIEVMRKNGPVYTAVPVKSAGLYVAFSDVGLLNDEIVGKHHGYIREAASRKRVSPFRAAHSPAAVRVLESLSNISIPQPSYAIGQIRDSDVDDESIEQKLNELATSKEVEQEAIREVTEWYELHGWHVESKEADHIGYDLHCTKGSECRHVEVKGRSQLPDVVLFTVNEWNNAVNDGQFYVAIVSGIGNKRRPMIQWTAQEFQREYEVKPIVYHAKRLNEGKDTYTR